VLRNLRKPKSPITDGLLVLARTAIPLRRGHDLQTHATSNIHHNHQPIWDRRLEVATMDCNPSTASAMSRIGIPIASASGPSDIVPKSPSASTVTVTTEGTHRTTAPAPQAAASVGREYSGYYPDDTSAATVTAPGPTLTAPATCPRRVRLMMAAQSASTSATGNQVHMAGRRLPSQFLIPAAIAQMQFPIYVWRVLHVYRRTKEKVKAGFRPPRLRRNRSVIIGCFCVQRCASEAASPRGF
jgi:hypothetical protein